MTFWHDFHGPNAGYVLELYERYRHDPASVDEATRAYFDAWRPGDDNGPPAPAATPAAAAADLQKIVGAANLAQAIREYGHLAAQLDPLGQPPPGDPALKLATYGLTEDDLRRLPAGLIGGPLAETSKDALESIQALRTVYATTIGYDYDHLRVPEERDWLRQAAESRRFSPAIMPLDEVELLKQLTQVETFEHFLHRTFPGKTRFSIEGLDMLAPMLLEILYCAGDSEIYAIMLGMAHRGRLNVLAHVLHKPYVEILAEFKDPVGSNLTSRNELGWTGDVKYHKGAHRLLRGDEVRPPEEDEQPLDLSLYMAPNPSHLEHVNPVVAGMARAAGTRMDRPGPPHFDPNASLPVLIHGDASFAAQGIVAETLNFSRLPGYSNGGTIHIIANNQLGFTTDPGAGRSTLYASDLAKGFKIPIVHVNADDPEACLEVARLAFAYREEFERDFVIDLIGYRRYGHNEGDEPRFTQPLLYERIENHPTVRAQWAQTLVERGTISADEAERLVHPTSGTNPGYLQ